MMKTYSTYSIQEIGRAVFHINTARVEDGKIVLEVLIDRCNNEVEQSLIEFPTPPEYQGKEEYIPEFCGMHMMGFEGGQLADARTVFGYVCPCSF